MSSNLKLHNTMTRTIEPLVPQNSDNVNLYTCGLTVYSQPHIGNWVAYIYWDILERTLRASGLNVNRVQNITDVGHLTSDEDAGEDKMLKSALSEGTTAWEVAEKYIKIADDEAYNQLGLLRPIHMPRATEYIPQQIAFVKGLEEKGYTYTLKDGVYFDTSKLSDYGKLAKLDIEGLQFGARVADTGKKNPTDFAVWKFSPEGQKRDMEWDSPWGKGFPGWHLECSVMARELLGDTIDIHTGGIDHIPVHHTNEIAQSEALTGKTFANMWVHANHIKVDGTKMSKSLGNIYTLEDVRKHGFSLMAFKLLILDKHYRVEGNFTWENLDSAQKVWNDIAAWSDLRFQLFKSDRLAEYYTETLLNFKNALEDDLGTHSAIVYLQAMVKRIEELGIDSKAVEQAVETIDSYLGLKLRERMGINSAQEQLIKEREQARKERDWLKSDKLRDKLLEDGISVRDTSSGSVWSRLSDS